MNKYNIKMFKIALGVNVLDVIAKVANDVSQWKTNGFVELEDALMVMFDEQSSKVKFGKFDAFSEGTSTVYSKFIVAESAPLKPLIEAYLNTINPSAIIQPEKQKIIIP